MKSILLLFKPGSVRLLLFAAFLISSSAGCHSPHSTSSPYLAAILIKDSPRTEVERITQAVFEDHGYQRVRLKSGEWVFDKEGTGMNTLVYGDWSTKKIWVRVKVFVEELKPARQMRLACDAFMVGEHGDPRFEEEHKLTSMHRGRYQDLLEQINQRLNFN
jgi:hypothetical protein